MKKLLLVLAAGLLVFGVAGQAKATFTDGDLIRVMYDTTTGVEIATDLGAISTLAGKTNYSNFDTVSLSQFNSGTNTANWSQVNVAYFGDVGGSYTAYVAAGSTPTPGAYSKYFNFQSASNNIEALYGSLTRTGAVTGTTVVTTTGNPNGYYFMMNGNGSNQGTFSNIITSGAELNMTSPVQQQLYALAIAGTSNYYLSVSSILSLATTLNGNVAGTTINPSATPIPPSILLLGSGLLGLVGVGRKRLFG